MSFPSKEQRSICWTARDNFWECLNRHQSHENPTKTPSECEEFRRSYEQGCPSQWVKHFDRKREYLKFKEKIEKQGYEPLENDRK